MKIIHSGKKDDAQFIHNNLYAFNCLKTGKTPQEIILEDNPNRSSIVLFSDDGKERLGGLVYQIQEDGVFFVDFLWVSDALRGQGMGKKLLEEGIAEAGKRNCRTVKLYTFAFQAPEFYKKMGFSLTEKKKDPALDAVETYYYEMKL